MMASRVRAMNNFLPEKSQSADQAKNPIYDVRYTVEEKAIG
jgi:hypothetical protein